MSVKSFKTSGVGVDLAPQGLVLINTTSFSAVSSVSAPNGTFSATYDNYLIKFNNITASVNGNYATMRMRASGSDDSAANYRQQVLEIYTTTEDSFRAVNQTSWTNIWFLQTDQNDGQITLCNPFNAKPTSGTSDFNMFSSGNIEYKKSGLGLNTTTSYDSVSLIAGSGTITGSMSIYGYGK
jgi:hypothetical protein